MGKTLAIGAVLVIVALYISTGIIGHLPDTLVIIALVAQALLAAVALAAVDALVLAISWIDIAPLIRVAIARTSNVSLR